MNTETPAPTDVVTDTGAEIGLTDAERAEVENAKTEAATPAAAPAPAADPAPVGEEDAEDAPVAQNGDVATLAAAAVQAAQAATAAVGEMAAQRAAAAVPAPTPAAPAEPDWAAQKAALKAKYDAGELDDDEYETRREELIEKRSDYNASKRAEQIAEQIVSQKLAKAAEQTAEQQWNTAFGTFRADPDNAAFIEDPVRATAFNATLQAIAKQNPTKSYAELLIEARDTVRTAFGLPKPAAQANAAAVKKAEAERAKARPPAPPDMARAPSAGTPPGGDNFAALDAMGIDELENALARMKPEQVAAYLEGAPGGLRDNPRSA